VTRSAARDSDLEALAAELATLDEALRVLVDPGERDVDEIASVLEHLDSLGVPHVMTPMESARLSVENLGSMLSDPLGISTLRGTVSDAADMVEAIRSSGLYDWREYSEPEVMFTSDRSTSSADKFDAWASRVAYELGEEHNIAFFQTHRVETLEHVELLPPVYAVVTNNAAYRDWTKSWGGLLFWWRDIDGGVRLEQSQPSGIDESADFLDDQYSEAAAYIYDTLMAPAPKTASERPPSAGPTDAAVTVAELRSIEALITALGTRVTDLALSLEDRARLEVFVAILQLQLRAPEPDRPIIHRCLIGLRKVTAGLALGVAGNLLTELLQTFV